MHFYGWQIWVIVALLLLIVESFIPTFVAASFAIGCVVAGVFAYLGFGLEAQLAAFSAGVLVAFFAGRPFMLKYGHRKNKDVKTNVDSLVGKTGRVIEVVEPERTEGRVVVEGDNWRAESENTERLVVGQNVEVVKVDTTILIIKPLK